MYDGVLDGYPVRRLLELRNVRDKASNRADKIFKSAMVTKKRKEYHEALFAKDCGRKGLGQRPPVLI